MLELDKEKKILIGCIASSFFFYHTARQIYSYISAKSQEWIPIGVVKSLHIYPIKSCKPVDLFAFKCTKAGPVMGELEDRAFVLVDVERGQFVFGRQKPKLVLVECRMESETLEIKVPGRPKLVVDLKKVVENGKLLRATFMVDKLQQDGYDCGDEVSELLSDYCGEKNYRLMFYVRGLYTEREFVPNPDSWNNPVPNRKDDCGYTNLAPFLLATEASMKDLNARLAKPISFMNFRPSIYIENSIAWDEDKWSEVRVGNALFECAAPCPRCILTTVDPENGEMSKENEPLREMRKFRMASEQKMRKAHKDSPVFGVYAGMRHEAYIHVGQTVYVRYKPSKW